MLNTLCPVVIQTLFLIKLFKKEINKSIKHIFLRYLFYTSCGAALLPEVGRQLLELILVIGQAEKSFDRVATGPLRDIA